MLTEDPLTYAPLRVRTTAMEANAYARIRTKICLARLRLTGLRITLTQEQAHRLVSAYAREEWKKCTEKIR